MNNLTKEYIEIENAPCFYNNKIYTDQIADTILCNMPVELQELSFSSKGKGHRNAYNYRSTVSFDFDSNVFSPFLKPKLHKHEYFEMILNVSGQFEMQIESQLCELNRWDVCILNRVTRHAEHFRPKDKIFYIVLSPDFLLNWPQEYGMKVPHSIFFTKFFNKGLASNLQQNKDFITARYTNQIAISPLHSIIENIRREFENKQPGYQLFIRGLIYRLLNILSDSEYYTAEYVDLGSDDGFSLAFSAKKILDESKQKMTKVELAERLNYNSEYINQVFKRHYGQTIPEYNRMVCLQQASYLLTNTDMPIYKICQQLGITNRTHFYNLFKQEYGCTLADYRRKGDKAALDNYLYSG